MSPSSLEFPSLLRSENNCESLKRRISFFLTNRVPALLLDKKVSETVSVFTDGSKNFERKKFEFGIFGGLRSPLNCSMAMTGEYDINAAELYAIVYVLERILKLKMDTKPIVVYTDCLNALNYFQRERFEDYCPTCDRGRNDPGVDIQCSANCGHSQHEQIGHAGRRDSSHSAARDPEQNPRNRETVVAEDRGPSYSLCAQDDQKDFAERGQNWSRGLDVCLKETSLWQEPATPKSKENNFCTNSSRSIHHLASQCRKGVYIVRSPGYIGIGQNEVADVLATMSVFKEEKQPLYLLFHQCWGKNRVHQRIEEIRKPKSLETMTLEVVHIPHCTRILRPFVCENPVLKTIWNNDLREIDYQMGEMLRVMKKLDVGRVSDLRTAGEVQLESLSDHRLLVFRGGPI